MTSVIAIKITLTPAATASSAVRERLRHFANQHRFVINNADNSWHAVIYDGEGEDVKARLRQQGFTDTDFSLNVEYQRRWGFL